MPQGAHYKESAQDPHMLLHKDPEGRNPSPKQCVVLSFQAHTKLKLVKGTQRIMAIKTELNERVLRFCSLIATAVCVYLCVGFNVFYIKHPAYLIVLWLSNMLIK